MKPIVSTIYILMLLCIPMQSYADPVKEIRNLLQPKLESLKTAAGNNAPLLRHAELDAFLGTPHNSNAYNAGWDLLADLMQIEDAYFALNYSQWLDASHYLMKVDDYVSTGKGRGNIAIKLQINQMLIDGVQLWSIARKPDQKRMKSLLSFMEEIRFHLLDWLATDQILYEHRLQASPSRSLNASMDTMDAYWLGVFEIYNQLEIGTIKDLEHGLRFLGLEEKHREKLLSTEDRSKERKRYQLALYGGAYSTSFPGTHDVANRWWKLKVYTQVLLDRGMEFDEWVKLRQKSKDEKVSKTHLSGWYQKLVNQERWAQNTHGNFGSQIMVINSIIEYLEGKGYALKSALLQAKKI